MDRFKKYTLNVWVCFQWLLAMIFLVLGMSVQLLLCLMIIPAIGFKGVKLKYNEIDAVTGFLRTFKAFASLETFKKYLH